MQRTSLDGKGRKHSDALSKHHQALKSQPSKHFYPENLREASPPKTNPWRRNQTLSSHSEGTATYLDQEAWPRAEDTAAAAINQTLPTPAITPARTPTTEDEESQSDAPPLQDPTPSLGLDLTSHSGFVLAPHSRLAPIARNASRAALEAAAARAGESLWHSPFGADIWLYAEDQVILCHRNVVAPKSGWIREKLLPPHSNGAPVGVYFPGAAKIIGHSLKFMYTDRVDPCELKSSGSRDVVNVICCSLFYIVAIDLAIPSMALHTLKTLAHTAKHWKDLIATALPKEPLTRKESSSFMLYLNDAFDAAYGHPHPDAVKPLRFALVKFFDAVVPLVTEYPAIFYLFTTTVWQRHASQISADLVECRRSHDSNDCTPSLAELKALFEKVPRSGRDLLISGTVAGFPRAPIPNLGAYNSAANDQT